MLYFVCRSGRQLQNLQEALGGALGALATCRHILPSGSGIGITTPKFQEDRYGMSSYRRMKRPEILHGGLAGQRLLEQNDNCLNGMWQRGEERNRLDNDSPATSRRRVTGSEKH